MAWRAYKNGTASKPQEVNGVAGLQEFGLG